MNKLLWLECIEDLDKNEIVHEWDIYDTHIGLLYLKQKSSTKQIGINTYAFALLEDPFDLDRINKVAEDAWPYKLAELFDITHWQKYHNNPASKIVVYMNGHGTQRMKQLEDQLACGIRASSFAQVLTFLHDKLQISLLGIQSCFWTTERIHELLKQLGYEYPRFTVLSPLSSEEGLWLDTIGNYLRKKDTCHCFFDCCMSFTEKYQETITDEIKDIINNTDTLQLDGNKHQRATLLAAGTNQLIFV